MLRNTVRNCLAPALAAACALPTMAGDELTFIESFGNGPNIGDWTWGNNFERIVPQAGNAGAWRYNFNLVSCCPNVRTRWGQPSVFTGNLRERGVTSIGVDLAEIVSGAVPPGCHYNGVFVDTFAAGSGEGWRGDVSGSDGSASFSDVQHQANGPDLPARPSASMNDADAGESAGAGAATVWLVLVNDSGTPGNFNDDWGAFIAVQPRTVTPGQGGGFLPNPQWASYDLIFEEGWLESESFPPGWQTIQFGPSVPDGAIDWQNLITDVAQVQWHLRNPGLVHLIQSYRVGIDNARITMLPAAPFTDCNNSGAPDAYDIATDVELDLNRNSVPDSCEIAAGLELDCNDNGVIDAFEADDATYRLETGYHNDAIGTGPSLPPGSKLIWALQMDAGDGDVVENIAVAFHGSGGLAAGAPVTLFVWDDPNNDGNPSDAVLLRSLETSVLSVNAFSSTGLVNFDTYAVEPTPVSGSFFVGAMASGATFPSMTDVTLPAGELSWTGDTVSGNPTDAFRAASNLPADCLSGTFMIRVNGQDADNNSVPDVCDDAGVPGDLNGDGSVNVSDLLLLLGAWGACDGCPADLNGDGQVNVSDMLALLSEWG